MTRSKVKVMEWTSNLVCSAFVKRILPLLRSRPAVLYGVYFLKIVTVWCFVYCLVNLSLYSFHVTAAVCWRETRLLGLVGMLVAAGECVFSWGMAVWLESTVLSLRCGLFSGSYCGGGFDVVSSPVLLSPSFQRQRCLSESDYSSMSESSKSEVIDWYFVYL